jgi:hypothetical protein
MPLNIHAKWNQPVVLTLGGAGAIYSCPDIGNVPDTAGVYVFYRQFGDNVIPLYIGMAANIRGRLEQYLNSVRLMVAIVNALAGGRYFMCCEVEFRRGQDRRKVLKTLESALIAHALAEGHELLNKQGIKRPNHTIQFTGNRASESLAPRFMRMRAI